MPTKKNDVTKIDVTKFSPELKAALIRFSKTHTRFKAAGYATETTPSGSTVKLAVTRPRSIKEDYDEARAALLIFRSELPLLAQIDYETRRKHISQALGNNATDDEFLEEYAAAEADIKSIEDKIAVICLKLELEK
jgi:hypothetical protein